MLIQRQLAWKNPVILYGFSRGVAWANELVLEHASLLGAAVALAGFPRGESKDENFHAARQ
eukprot:6708716-Lingulodinium_polyedra.AAC.1